MTTKKKASTFESVKEKTVIDNKVIKLNPELWNANEGQEEDKEEVSEMVFWTTLAKAGKWPTHIDGVPVHINLKTALKNVITKPIDNPFSPKVDENGVYMPGKSTHKDEQSGKIVEDEQLIQTAVIIATGSGINKKEFYPGMIIQYYSRTARPVPFDFYKFEATSEANILASYSIVTK